MQQHTIKNIVTISGTGIHTGVFSKISLLPAKEDFGIQFRRIDIKQKPFIKAIVDNVTSTSRSTNLSKDDIYIYTVEHLLAAIAGENIDNVLIEIDNTEVPILDGSAKDFSELLSKAGKVKQNKKRTFFEIKRKIIHEGENGVMLIAEPDDNFSVEAKIDYNSKTLPPQKASLLNITDFKTQIAPSRTFCFLHELEALLESNLIKGGDINNAIVIVEKKINKKKIKFLSKIFQKEDIKVEIGILNNLELRYKNEPARHKLLDVIGDLSLLGRPIKGKITVEKPGHTNNIIFTKKLKRIMEEEIQKASPKINFLEKPLYNKKQLKKILPHRDPFLFVDEIRDIGANFIIGVKFVKSEEDYFRGHFPKTPIMPGVIQLETMAQAGGVLILNTVKNPQDYLTYFMKIDNAKFKKKVIPGDTLIFRLDLISPIRRGLCHMHGRGFVNNQLVVEADLLAQITKK